MKKLIPIILSLIFFNMLARVVPVPRTGRSMSSFFVNTANAQESLPDLTVASVIAPDTVSIKQDFDISWTVSNSGNAQAPATVDWLDYIYISSDQTLDASDTQIGMLYHSEMAQNGDLAPGQNYTNTQAVNVSHLTAGGSYYIIVETDVNKDLSESNEANNILSVPINVGIPDLTIDTMSAPSQSLVKQTIEVSWTVKNQGNAEAVMFTEWGWQDAVYLSEDDKFDSADTLLTGVWHNEALAVGQQYAANASIQMPDISGGNRYILVKTDSNGNQYESNEDNNLSSSPILIVKPDLIITALTAPAESYPDQSFDINWTVKNQGDGEAVGSWCSSYCVSGWYEQFYLSKDQQIDDSDTYLTSVYRETPLAAGSEYSNTVSVQVPGIPAGNYYLLAKTDIDNWVNESNDDNNIITKPVFIGVSDLIVSAMTAPAKVSPDEVIDVTWTVKNQGNGQAIGYFCGPWSCSNGWYDKVYLSQDAQLDDTDTELFLFNRSELLAAGSEYTAAASIQMPAVVSENYYLIVKTDSDGTLYESNENNNVLNYQINTQGLQITSVKWNDSALTNGQALIHPGEISIGTSSTTGVSKVEFYIDGNLYKTDTDTSYSFYWNIAKESDGNHILKIAAYDTFAKSTSVEYTVNVTLEAPAIPNITEPLTGQNTNNSSIAVTGTAESESEIILYNNDTDTGVKATADKGGNFSANLSLSLGENKIQSAAKNRAGTGSLSAAVIVTYDNTVPNAPRQLTAESKENGIVKLTWLAPLETPAKGYNLYRAGNSFTNKADAAKINTDLITGNSLNDLPPQEGTFYYRAAAVSSAGNESELSEEAAGISDNTAPKAVSIVFTPKGKYDSTTQTFGIGEVDVLLTVSEKLQSVPFLSITPEGASPISLELIEQSETTGHSESPVGGEESQPKYKGTFAISDSTPSGTAYAVFSARDIAGNRGTEITTGQTIKIDTQGPSVIDLKVEPKSPIKNDSANPATLMLQ